MFKKILIVLIFGVFFLGISKLSFGQGETVSEAKPAKEAINVGNKICPVSGEKINEKLKATFEYEGKVYNFCCAMCINDFKKDPQKYIKKVEEELKKQASQIKKEDKDKQEPETHSGMHEGHQHH